MGCVTHFGGIAFEGTDCGLDEFAVGPLNIDFESAAGAEAGDFAVGPGAGEGGEKVDVAFVTLNEHFGDAGCAAEIAIDLEGWMVVEEVW